MIRALARKIGHHESVGSAGRPVVLFDGVCHLCNWFVRFVIQRDAGGGFDFAPLQSTLGQSLSGQKKGDSIVLAEGGRQYEADEAVLRILSRLSGPWPSVAKALGWWPKPLRRWGYRLIARSRYAIFGREVACSAPRPEWKSRFLS